ncbi:MarR family transcriptional regulator [Azotosporobacter soli]|uniref:MarR family winged helix-turn-helix transcriptional regulator n=1 Tax=Azotosporobacter soli TaxID=3055040 RepID=UPI0031FEF718
MSHDKQEEMLRLDNQLCFAVYASAKAIVGAYRTELEKIGLTYTQYIALLALWEKEEMTLKELGRRLFLDSGTLTPMLKKMAAAGLLTRLRSTTDERNMVVRLTEQGRALKSKVYSLPEQTLCASKLSLEEAVQLREQLKRLLHALQE